MFNASLYIAWNIWDFNLITVSAVFVFNNWYDTYRDTYRVSDQCIDDTYRISDTIHKTTFFTALNVPFLDGTLPFWKPGQNTGNIHNQWM